jgi:hypothetical protein
MKEDKLEPFTFLQFYSEREYVSLYYWRKYQKSIEEKLKIGATVLIVTLMLTMYSRFQGNLSPFYELLMFSLVVYITLRPIFVQIKAKKNYRGEVGQMNPLMITIDQIGILLTWEGGSMLTVYREIHHVEEDSRYYLFFLNKSNCFSIPKFQVSTHDHNNLCKWLHLNLEKEKIKKGSFHTKYE